MSSEEKKEEIKEKDNIFYICEQIVVDKVLVDNSNDKFNLQILNKIPEKPQPDTYYLTPNSYTWDITYVTPLLQKIHYNKDHTVEIDLSSLKDDLQKISNKENQKLNDEINKKFQIILKENNILNKGYKVGVGGSNCGKTLYSTDFSPCHAVVAILKNGGYGLYHALSSSSGSFLDKFIDIIRDEVVCVYVFYKPSNIKNFATSPLLAASIATELYPT